MVTLEESPGSKELLFRITPNRSLSGTQTRWLLLGFGALFLSLAGYFAAIDAWPIVPFFGLEFLLLACGLGCHAKHAGRQEIIRLNQREIKIDRSSSPRDCVCLPRAWLKVRLIDGPGWHPAKLFIGAHGRFHQIGQSLVERDREYLSERLQAALQSPTT